MDTKLALVELLTACPKDMKLYSTTHGEVALNYVSSERVLYPICVSWGDGLASFTQHGRFYTTGDGECTLFASEDQGDGRKVKVPVEKFDDATLKSFDKVLVRDADRDIWRCNLFTCFRKDQIVCGVSWRQGIPYNEETKHLAGTADMPDEKYIWWEE